MKPFLTLMLGIAVFAAAKAQTLTLRDQETLEPITNAAISSQNKGALVFADSRGQANISSLRGATDILFNITGYKIEMWSFDSLEKAGFQVLLTPSIKTLDQVVVSSTRWTQQRREVPSRITSISSKDVALQNPQTAADMLGSSGEVYIQKSQQGGGSPMIRGFATNRLLYTVDGVRMNTAIFRGGNLQNVISLDPFAIDRTEIFFGPGSVVYGSDAIGGVMSFRTLTPDFSSSNQRPLVHGKAVTRHSSANNERTGHLDVSVGWKKWAIATSFSRFKFEDLRQGSKGPQEFLRPFYVQRMDSIDHVVTNNNPLVQVPTAYNQINLMQKIRYAPNQNWDIQYGFHYSETSPYSRYDRHTRYTGSGLPRSAEWAYGPQIWMMNNLNITHKKQNAFYSEMSVRLAQQHFEESRIDRDMNDPERRTRLEKVEAYSVNVDFTKTFNLRHRIFYGLEGVLNQVKSTGTDEDISTGVTVAGPARYPQANWSSYAAYLSYQFKMTEQFLLQAGARYNQFMLDATFDTSFYPFPYTKANINNGAVTGNLGLIYNPTEKWTFSINASTGFRSPNVDDAGKVFDSEPGSVLVPNPNLNAEYAYNGEVGIAKVFGNSVKVDVSGYYTILNNALVRRDFQLNGQDSIMYDGTLSQVQAIQNAAVATVYGVQASLEVKLRSGFGFNSQFNYQKGTEELDNGQTSPLRHAAPWFGASHLTYSMSRLKMDCYAMYSGEMTYSQLSEDSKGTPYIYAKDKDGNPYAPGWYTINFKAMYQLTENFSVSGGVENITDQRYRTYTSGISAPGRNFVLSMKASF